MPVLHPNKDIRFRGSEYVFDIVFTDLTLDDPGVSSEVSNNLI